MSELVKVGEVAEMVQVTRPTAWAWARAGRLPGVVRLGRTVRFQRAAVLEWVERGCPLPPSEKAGASAGGER